MIFKRNILILLRSETVFIFHEIHALLTHSNIFVIVIFNGGIIMMKEPNDRKFLTNQNH